MRTSKFVLAAAATAALGIGVSSASAAHIDTFESSADNQFNLTVDGNDSTTTPNVDSVDQSGLDTDVVVGGEREVTLTFDSGDGSAGSQDRITANNGDSGRLSFSADSGEQGTLELLYDGLDNTDLTGGGIYDGFLFNFIQADAGSNFTVEVTDSDSDSDSLSRMTTANPNNFTFDFAGYDSGVDFTSVDSVRVEINGAISGDYTLEGIRRTVIPTPAALPGGLALLGLAALRRRRRA